VPWNDAADGEREQFQQAHNPFFGHGFVVVEPAPDLGHIDGHEQRSDQFACGEND
jgi:hypothetical protein